MQTGPFMLLLCFIGGFAYGAYFARPWRDDLPLHNMRDVWDMLGLHAVVCFFTTVVVIWLLEMLYSFGLLHKVVEAMVSII